MLATDFGLGLVLVVTGGLMVWRLTDLFKQDGLWSSELETSELNVNKTATLTQAGRDAMKKELEL